jgi:hypothetical protein
MTEKRERIVFKHENPWLVAAAREAGLKVCIPGKSLFLEMRKRLVRAGCHRGVLASIKRV